MLGKAVFSHMGAAGTLFDGGCRANAVPSNPETSSESCHPIVQQSLAPE